MRESISVPSDGLVLHVGILRALIWATTELSKTETLVLLRLLERTADGVAEASYASLADDCRMNKRTLARLLPDMRGWFDFVPQGGNRPSLFRWRRDGALASAWGVKPGLTIVRSTPLPGQAAEASDGACFGLESASSATPHQVGKALASLYSWHAEWRRRRRTTPDPYRLTPAEAQTWTAWIVDLATRCEWSIDKTTGHALGEWFALNGSNGCLRHAQHPLAMLFTQNARDLHVIGNRVLEKRLAYLDEDFDDAPAAAPDHDLNLAAADQLLAAIGGR